MSPELPNRLPVSGCEQVLPGRRAALPVDPTAPWLAPLAGFSDLPFRLLCREYGCRAAFTEMVSAKGLLYQSPGTVNLLHTCPGDQPLVVQLFGSETGVLCEALGMLMERGYTVFDLNAGCPVKKVVKTGAGAGLLRDWDHLLNLLMAMVETAGEGRVGVKLRAGFTHRTEVLDRIGDLQALGLGWVTVHPRTATQGYAGEADWDVLAAIKARLKIPVVASGDLFTAWDGVRCVQTTGVNGLMFARGALADPSIFGLYTRMLQGDPVHDLHNRAEAGNKGLALARRHIQLTREHGAPHSGLLKMRTIIPRYLRGFHRVKEIRRRVVACGTWQALLDCLEAVEEEINE